MDTYVLGKYIPHDTLFHRLDPRAKILMLIMFIVTVFLPYDTYALTYTLLCVNFIIAFFVMMSSKVRFRDLLFQLKTLWFLILVLMLINIFMPPAGSTHIIVRNGGFTLYEESFLQSGKILLRLLVMFAIAMSLTASTSPQDLTFGFSFFISPLKRIRFPSEEIAMTISIALRFIPTLLQEANKIFKAQASRGVDFKHGSIKEKFKGAIALVIPLFVSSFAMSDDLAFALEARGYNPKEKRTRYKLLHWKSIDTLMVLLTLIHLGIFIALCASHYDPIKLIFPLVY